MSVSSGARQDTQYERVDDVDALRGFALLGIFVVNITFMASAYPANLVNDPSFSTWSDDAARFVVDLLFSMKFYLLFSFLFGYSFVLQIGAAHRAGRAFVPRMLRRILGLFILGALHIVFLYGGDVLTTYAVAGLVLLAMYRVADKTALKTALSIYAVLLVSLLASAVFLGGDVFKPSKEEALRIASEQTDAFLGAPTEIIGYHLDGLGLLVIQAFSLQGPTALAMFLLGMVAARRNLLGSLSDMKSLLLWTQVVGYSIGLAGGLTFALLGGSGNTMGVAVSVMTSPFLAAAYGASLVRVMALRKASWVRSILAPVGRVALTNYLAQSVVGLLLFTSVGFGLAGEFSPPVLIVTAAVVFSIQAGISAWWLIRHRYGPAEYALRWFTNWQRPINSVRSNKPTVQPRAHYL